MDDYLSKRIPSAEFEPYFHKVVKAHAVLGCVAWVIFFPLGAILIRVIPGPRAWIIHGSMMAFGLILLTANVGMGIWQVHDISFYHAIIGLTVFALAWLQPASGLLHHRLYLRHGRRTIFSFLHMSIGRALITLGIVNGALGMSVGYANGNFGRAEVIVYLVFSSVIWAAYFLVSFRAENSREASRSATAASGGAATPVGGSTSSSSPRSLSGQYSKFSYDSAKASQRRVDALIGVLMERK